jgi:hypothetical protein
MVCVVSMMFVLIVKHMILHEQDKAVNMNSNTTVLPRRKRKKRNVIKNNSYFKRKINGLIKTRIEPYSKNLHPNQAIP